MGDMKSESGGITAEAVTSSIGALMLYIDHRLVCEVYPSQVQCRQLAIGGKTVAMIGVHVHPKTGVVLSGFLVIDRKEVPITPLFLPEKVIVSQAGKVITTGQEGGNYAFYCHGDRQINASDEKLAIDDVVFAPDGKTWGGIVRGVSCDTLYVNDVMVYDPPEGVKIAMLTFSDDSQHWAVVRYAPKVGNAPTKYEAVVDGIATTLEVEGSILGGLEFRNYCQAIALIVDGQCHICFTGI